MRVDRLLWVISTDAGWIAGTTEVPQIADVPKASPLCRIAMSNRSKKALAQRTARYRSRSLPLLLAHHLVHVVQQAFLLSCILRTMARSAGEARMSLLFHNVRRLSAGSLLVFSMCEPASAQLPPDGSQTDYAQAIEGQEVRTSANECSRATPLPADTTITPPGADVPADVARFSGA